MINIRKRDYDKIEIEMKGNAVKTVEILRRITHTHEPIDVVIAALRTYEWILARQTKGEIIMAIAEDGQEQKLELVNYVKDKEQD